MSECRNVARALVSSGKIALASLIAFNTVAFSQWTDDGNGSYSIVLDPGNSDVEIVVEGLDYTTYGVWAPAGSGGDSDYVEFDVEHVNWNRFDINTTGATVTDEEAWGWPDGRVDVADVRLFLCLYQNASAYADINSTGAARGDTEYGVMDGVVDGADLQFFTDWLEEFASLNVAIQLIADALENFNPCTTRADDEPQMAPREPKKQVAGVLSTTSGDFPGLLDGWVYVIARDILKPQSSLDLQVIHRADIDDICHGEPGATHFSEAWTEVGFFASMSAVATGLTEVLNDRDYDITEDCFGNGSGMRVGDSTLRTMYRVTYKLGAFIPINAWWAGLGTQKTMLTRQISSTGCGCP